MYIKSNIYTHVKSNIYKHDAYKISIKLAKRGYCHRQVKETLKKIYENEFYKSDFTKILVIIIIIIC